MFVRGGRARDDIQISKKEFLFYIKKIKELREDSSCMLE